MFRGPLTVIALRLGAVIVLYTVSRVLFAWLNSGLFPEVPMASFVGGVRFDISAIAWLNLLSVALYLWQPTPSRKWMRDLQLAVFVIPNAVALFFQFVDLGYYPFSQKRSTADFLRIITTGDDTASLAPAFMKDYWHLLLMYLGAVAALFWAYRLSARHAAPVDRGAWRIGWRLILVGAMVIGTRGGLQLVPLQPLDAARYGGAAVLPVTLNTPFTMLMSLGKATLVDRHYMTMEQAEALWPVHHDLRHPATLPHRPWEPLSDTLRIATDSTPTVTGALASHPNVVVIILESFSAVYSAELAGGTGYMPFLDSLMRTSLHFTRAYANGRRSIDGIPAILAGMPEMMDEAFITSPYAGRPFTSLANILGAEGYRTSFYHGGRNGTMGFDGFARSAGFQRYVGLNEYRGTPEDHDGHWGIRDRPFLQFYAQELNREEQPFMSTVFTLSSHHPYELPEDEAKHFEGGTLPIHPTLRYTDDALRQFFSTARRMPWYANTIFVITADHTADLERNGQHSDKPIDHWIPLVVHAPGRVGQHAYQGVTQQIDILGMVLDLAGYEAPFFSFGHSPLRPGGGYAIMASNGIYRIISAQAQVQFDGKLVVGVQPLNGHTSVPEAVTTEMEQRLKAAIQQYDHHLLHGGMVVSTQRNQPAP